MLTAPSDIARSILNAAPDAMVIVDETGVIRFANRQVSALFGYANEELIGSSIEQLLPERYRDHHATYRLGYARSGRVRPMGQGLDLYGRRRDGSEFPVEISLSPIQQGEVALIAAAVRDVTDRKRVEAELIAARENALRLRESADRANQAKSRFLAAASHDLRQPLQSLALLSGTLRRIVSGSDAIEALTQQDQAIGAMTRLLNALLDIGKLESGAVKPEPRDFALAALLDELHREFSGIAANKGLKLEFEGSAASVHSDPALVEQILRNLVSNAVKYTRSGIVRLRCHHEAASVTIDVTDSGIGIAKEQLGYIFDEFYQVGARASGARDGYGLGLSIVQRLVNLLGLRMEVESEVGRGSTFSLSLPAGHGATSAVQSSSRRQPAVPRGDLKASVLLVEDDPAVRAATRLLLAVEGYDVTPVGSLADALAAVQERGPPDLLITDFHLSDDETGLDVIAALRAECGSSLKAVLTTGDTSSAINGLPRDPYLRFASKPIEAEALLGLIRTLLST